MTVGWLPAATADHVPLPAVVLNSVVSSRNGSLPAEWLPAVVVLNSLVGSNSSKNYQNLNLWSDLKTMGQHFELHAMTAKHESPLAVFLLAPAVAATATAIDSESPQRE